MTASHRRPTTREVAALAGVSVATVSYVLNGKDGRVGEETRRRVLAAADELGYVRSSSARSLRLRRTERVCLVVGSIGVPAYDQLARDLSAAADEAGYGVMTIVVDSPARADKAVDLLRQHVADGAVVAPSVPLADAQLRALTGSRLPLVVMSNAVAPDGFDVVRTSEAAACVEAFDHLAATGRRRIAYLAHEHELTGRQPSERRDAYLDALDRHGLGPELVVPGADDRVGAYRAVEALLARPDRPDAIFAASDRAAITAILALRDAGLAVPEDVAVVGVGNLEEGRITRPPLTTVGPPAMDFHDVARLLFDRVLADETPFDREITTSWSFIRRGSA
ncbi:LacI family DNA-binding transcriptional regulator [Actinophytocola gossypii]|uniref:LacI family DNA-binding transcriptional regulator n=1 Tax=Actinophytocola gossypii TaxID=2812003 RepID=A0ABT2J8A1_9PSEU|nr:LacI family DNA-binding transcriptional regulator [Actinophytocola gossypii]MCT2583509.1 LacI family DNA-binding transcriptional regulator [Actinophytocola gossypii]